jgi:hypothetical protein
LKGLKEALYEEHRLGERALSFPRIRKTDLCQWLCRTNISACKLPITDVVTSGSSHLPYTVVPPSRPSRIETQQRSNVSEIGEGTDLPLLLVGEQNVKESSWD